MNIVKNKNRKLPKTHLTKLSVLMGLVSVVSYTQAASYPINDQWLFETNTTLSAGASWSTQNPQTSLLYHPDASSIGKIGTSIDTNGDDGHENFSKNDAISKIIRGFTEFRLNGQQQGAVLSTKYWYDYAYENGHGDFKSFNDSSWPKLAKFKGIDLWDAYVWKKIQFANDQSLNLKLGKQTFNWGKSQFFQNGLNSLNSYDYAAMNRPGGDAKEKIIPVEMFSFDTGLTEHLKLDGFYQLKYRPSVVDGCGTFFAISDFVPENCGPIVVTVAPGDKLTNTALQNHSYIPRTDSQYAKDNGQYGLSLKQTIPSLNNAELGLYYANYHSRNANFDGTSETTAGLKYLSSAEYHSIYPENIKMYGLSLTGKVGTTNIFTELTYKPNQPLQFNGTDIVYFQALSNETPFTPAGVTPKLGEKIQGYVRLPVTQFSLGASDSIANILGANMLNWSAEMGVNHIADIGNNRLGRTGAFGRSELSTGAYNPETGEHKCTPYGTANLPNNIIDNLNAKFCNRDGFFTEWSYGYRVRGALAYKDLLPATVISPSLIFRHDVHGYGQNFQQGQMSVGASLAITYMKNYSAELNYYNFFGSNKFSTINDRDFVSLGFKVNF